MTASSSTIDSVKNIFKNKFGKLNDLRYSGDVLDECLKFSEGEKVGDYFIESAILEDDVGMSWLGEEQGIFDLEAPVAGAIKQCKVRPTQTVLSSAIAWSYISRSAGGKEVAFTDGAKLQFKSHLESHQKLVRVSKYYGQSAALLGYVSYAPSTTVYRGATYSGDGTVTLTKQDGTTIAFTAGINAAAKAILMAPGNFAAGHWVGRKNMKIVQVGSTGTVLASGRLKSVDSRLGILYVDFTPVAASAVSGAGSVRVAYAGWEQNKCMVGMKAILENTGELFNIDAAEYSLWKSTVLRLGGKKFNLDALNEAVADAINAGGLDKPLKVIVNPRTFGKISSDESAMRKYDSSYQPAEGKNGFETVVFYAANGANKIFASNNVMEGDAFGIVEEDWVCSGSQMPSFRVLGMTDDIVFPLNNQTGFGIRSYGDEFVFCRKPARQILWTGINDEGAAYGEVAA